MLRAAALLASWLIMVASCNSSPGRLARMSALDTSAMIPLADAIAIARDRVPGGFPVEAALELEDDDENEPPAYEVVLYVAAEQQLIEVEVHAITGEVLEVEVQEDGDAED